MSSSPIVQSAADQEKQLRIHGFGDIIDSVFVQRLHDVSFLGVLDHVYRLAEPSSRYEHSIGAAWIALELARVLSLDTYATNLLVVAFLLHDIGHGPFSHNSEPFLIRRKSRYHDGVLTAFLRGHVVPDDSEPLPGILAHYGPNFTEDLSDILVTQRRTGGALRSLFDTRINCDKIEGNNRSLGHVGLPGVGVTDLLGVFVRDETDVYVRSASVHLVEDFFESERRLYWDQIYTSAVFAAEAALTRCLEMVFVTVDDVDSFMLSTDTEVRDRLRSHRYAGALMELMENGKAFHALSETEPSLYCAIRQRGVASQTDPNARSALERKISAAIGSDPELTISHSSRRKYFKTAASLRQLPLIEQRHGLIPLRVVNQALKTWRVPADYFEVFYPA